MNAPRQGRFAPIVGVANATLVLAVFLLVLRQLLQTDQIPALQIAFLCGTLLAALGPILPGWGRGAAPLVLSAALAAIGAGCLLAMSLAPFPWIDPALRATGAWTAGPLPPSAGWDRYVMATLLLLSGAVLPWARRMKSGALALDLLMIVRFCVWYGGIWQLAELSVPGGTPALFAKDASGFQLAFLLVTAVGLLLLLRGDRGWLAALMPANRISLVAHLVMAAAMLPLGAAIAVGLAVRVGALRHDMAVVVSAELSSILLTLVAFGVVRGIWRERRQASTLAKAAERSPLMVHSAEGLIEYWPRGCEVLFGYSADEAIGRRASELLHTEYPIPFPEVVETIRRTGEWAGEVGQTTRDGRKLWIATQVVADRPEPDSELKLVETMADITDLKLSREALRETTESFEQVIAGYELGTIEYWRMTGQARFSPQIEHILGLEPGALGSDDSIWSTLVHPDDLARIRALFLEDERVQAHARTVTFKVRRRDGQYCDLQGVVRLEYDEDGRLTRHVGVYMDVTEILRDRMDVAAQGARLLELQSELAHTSRLSAMGELAAGLAHELNQPLTAVSNSVGAIGMMLEAQDKPMDEPRRQRMLRAARHAETQALRAGEILRRLREFITRGEADTQAENLGALVDDALALALPRPASAGITVRKSIPRAAATVLADRIQVQQVLVNLIRNAVESMRDQEGPRVLSITAEPNSGMSLVRVVDSGSGVANDKLSTLFSPFVSTKREGMGVGLSICRRIIEAHGGELWFEPTEGPGAEFRFTLPLAVGDGQV